jgi:hypothetical protein
MEMSQANSLCSYLKQTKMTFFKNRGQEGKPGPAWGLAPVGRGGYKERVWEGECGGYYVLMNENGKMRTVDSRNGGRRIKENDGGVNSAMIYYKNFCKSHNAPPV